MLVIPKVDVSIVSSNVATIDPNFNQWVAGYNTTGYMIGDFVQIVSTDTIYRSAKDNNLIDPLTDTYNESWIEYGATNYKKAFDSKRSSKCENADTIYYEFSTSDIDSVSLMGLEAKTVTVKLTNNATATVMLEETIDTLERDVYDWYDWTYAQVDHISSLYKALPLVFDGKLEITIDNTGSIAKVSHIIYGRALQLGLTLAEPMPIASIRNIASKTRDVFGDLKTEVNITYKRMLVNVILNSVAVDRVQNRLEKLNGIPCMFVADEREGGYASLSIFGVHKDFDMPIGVSITKYQLEIEGFN